MVEYLRHVISHGGVATDPNKVSIVVNCPIPKSLRSIRGFLGLTCYYKHFIKGHDAIDNPLNQLLQKENHASLQWTAEAQQAFAIWNRLWFPHLRWQLQTSQNPLRWNVMLLDRIAGIVMQECCPIAFFNKALSSKNISKSTYEEEMIALVLAIRHEWRETIPIGQEVHHAYWSKQPPLPAGTIDAYTSTSMGWQADGW